MRGEVQERVWIFSGLNYWRPHRLTHRHRRDLLKRCDSRAHCSVRARTCERARGPMTFARTHCALNWNASCSAKT